MLGVRAREAVVHIGAHIDPVLIGFDLLFVLRDLQSDRNRLIQIICGHPAVGRNAQGLAFITLRRGCRGSDLVDVRTVTAFDLFEDSPFFPLAFRLEAGADGLSRPCRTFLCGFLHIVHVPYLLSAFLRIYTF